ncbi:hypothetical protein HOY82DRAFT_484106 [Tuber indicum]|nr:hypothetical protein HOY82DRAFT_484106 [Tuber indicum]
MGRACIRLNVIVVGAGLGGLGAAIAISLAGHRVTVLEASLTAGEIGAGIQIHPNASKILTAWGMRETLLQYATLPKQVNMIGWKGNHISHMNFAEHAKRYNSPFWDFHRASLHKCLLDRAVELGSKVLMNSRVDHVEFGQLGGACTVLLHNGRRLSADLVVGADGINSVLRERLVGRPDKPTPTGDLAYRLLIKTKDMMGDPELRGFVTDPQVNYWMGPDAHAVNYVLKGGEEFNMVLLVPDDIPEGGATTVEGNVDEMRAIYKDWDPRIGKLLALCESVYKWKLCIREELPNWSHPSGTFTLLGDSAHATLPYLASGAGMSLEDAAVLGECLSRISSKSDIPLALSVYEKCRKKRTTRVVQRGNFQQYLYHLHDGPEQQERDAKMRMVPTPPGECLPWRDPGFAPWLLGYEVLKDVEACWPKEMEGGRGGIREKGDGEIRAKL